MRFSLLDLHIYQGCGGEDSLSHVLDECEYSEVRKPRDREDYYDAAVPDESSQGANAGQHSSHLHLSGVLLSVRQ